MARLELSKKRKEKIKKFIGMVMSGDAHLNACHSLVQVVAVSICGLDHRPGIFFTNELVLK